MWTIKKKFKTVLEPATYPGFYGMKHFGVLPLLCGWDAIPLSRRLHPYQATLILPVPIYTPGWRLWSSVRVQCIAQNTIQWRSQVLSPTFWPRVKCTSHYSVGLHIYLINYYEEVIKMILILKDINKLTWGTSGSKLEVYAKTVIYNSGRNTMVLPGTENCRESECDR